ncbi:calcium/sodium antiporter [Ovoidimarina sediminis]|uniref:calcium/sodium antiporter n=1 Tax=Ovoidimarina sediminis TaxID=3079856 RepID=UPI00290B39D8|nr:calcium/sodium antiporter [Rhodophyticola sp. MJ-SS7]MDU8944028.1 calcium/sodium antiporter [Rhodophyticola sp. MJ-SS7]
MTQDLLLAGLGLVILLLAGDSLVRGAVNTSLRLGIPALIVSLTIVAFGTSAPELLIAVAAIKDNAPGIALGNVVGSNTANILMVLGLPALLAGLQTSQCETRKTYLVMLAVSIFFIGICFTGPLTWMHGLVLLAVLAVILFDQAREALAHRRANGALTAEENEEEEVEGADPEMGWPKIAVFLILGLIGLPLGADLLVDSSVSLARTFGVSETVIGLTLVAIGTSLPELATTVMAAYRRQADVALGNVIGSNMFNLLAIIGIATMVGPIPIDATFLRFDLWVMLGASLLLAPFVFSSTRDMGKTWGLIFTGVYAAYLWMVVEMGGGL